MELNRQESWSGQPFASPGNLPRLGSEPRSPALQADSLPSEPPGKPTSLRLFLKEKSGMKSGDWSQDTCSGSGEMCVLVSPTREKETKPQVRWVKRLWPAHPGRMAVKPVEDRAFSQDREPTGSTFL